MPERDSRQIRVFLSSTFRDFMQERDQLVKQVFPALRRRAQERGVEIVDVDLRPHCQERSPLGLTRSPGGSSEDHETHLRRRNTGSGPDPDGPSKPR